MIQDRLHGAESAPVAISRYGPTSPSTRVRIDDWFEHLGIRAERWNYVWTPNNRVTTLLPRIAEIAREELRLRVARSSLKGRTVIMSRGASPFSSGSLEESLLRHAAFSVYDFDDAIYVASRSPMRRFWAEDKAWRRSVEAADVVIAGSEVLADSASEIRDDVILIPSCVEPNNYTLKDNYEINKVPIAVWIGTPSTERFLTDIEDSLLALNGRFGLRVRVVSAGKATLGALDSIVDRIPWNVDTYQQHLTSADLGIMPLADTRFEQGKCAYKLLQYGATGLPSVGSPVGANVQALNRLGGIAVDRSNQGWENSVSAVIEATADERALMGANGRTGVEKHYSYAAWADTWLRAIRIGSGF